MQHTGHADRLDTAELDTIAWGFLCSEYTAPAYRLAPLDRRLDAYLRHRHLERIVNDGAVYGAVIDRVMMNFRRARRDGLLDPPRA